MEFKLSPIVANISILFILVLATLLRLINLESDPFWVDEQGHIEVALSQTIPDVFAGVKQHAGAAPLDYLLLRIYQHLTGAETRFAIRLPYVFYGVLSVFLIYQLGRLIYNPAVGLLSAYALSITFFHIYYSQEVRFYALSTLLGILSTIFFLNAWKNASGKNWLLWGFVCALGLYTHYFLAFVFCVQFGWLVINELRSRFDKKGFSRLFPPSVAFSLSLLVFLPWLLWAGNISINPSMGVSFSQALLSFLSGLWPSLVLLTLSSFGVFSKRESWLLLLMIVIPFLGVYLTVDISGYFFNARQVIFTTPFLILLGSATPAYFFATVFREAKKGGNHRRPIILATGLLLILVFSWANFTQILEYYL